MMNSLLLTLHICLCFQVAYSEESSDLVSIIAPRRLIRWSIGSQNITFWKVYGGDVSRYDVILNCENDFERMLPVNVSFHYRHRPSHFEIVIDTKNLIRTVRTSYQVILHTKTGETKINGPKVKANMIGYYGPYRVKVLPGNFYVNGAKTKPLRLTFYLGKWIFKEPMAAWWLRLDRLGKQPATIKGYKKLSDLLTSDYGSDHVRQQYRSFKAVYFVPTNELIDGARYRIVLYRSSLETFSRSYQMYTGEKIFHQTEELEGTCVSNPCPTLPTPPQDNSGLKIFGSVIGVLVFIFMFVCIGCYCNRNSRCLAKHDGECGSETPNTHTNSSCINNIDPRHEHDGLSPIVAYILNSSRGNTEIRNSVTSQNINPANDDVSFVGNHDGVMTYYMNAVSGSDSSTFNNQLPTYHEVMADTDSTAPPPYNPYY